MSGWPTSIYFSNHGSSRPDTSFISSYILGERTAGCYSEPFEPAELEAIIGPFHTLPLGLVPKPHTDTFHIIQDMLFPQNDPSLLSVNAEVNSDDFPMIWGDFESTSQLILTLPDGCQAETFNISAAYRLTPICPEQQNSLCVYWEGKVYVVRR